LEKLLSILLIILAASSFILIVTTIHHLEFQFCNFWNVFLKIYASYYYDDDDDDDLFYDHELQLNPIFLLFASSFSSTQPS
jgi:hypothetical protein